MRQPFTLALPVIESPPHAKAFGAGDQIALIWRQEVKTADGSPFRWYDVLAMDEKGRHFKLRLARADVEVAVANPRYFIESADIRGPVIGIVGHGKLVGQ